ncbi:hypothetical protein DPMN_072601 [Dreissena polymorpha]|uniref:Uncharacterized protein n=1 Tax=Dreissena polymorpha TaxID=45954 RepID=A0A9D4HBX6_DREPO|nr:hypothetical protein DPMN_072601 [Dreissena polymorpha]
MLYLSGQNNDLQQFISVNDIENITKASWKPVDELNIYCPIMTEDELICLILGVYTFKLAASYTQEHMSSDGIYSIHGYVHNRSLLCLKFEVGMCPESNIGLIYVSRRGQSMHGFAAAQWEHVQLEHVSGNTKLINCQMVRDIGLQTSQMLLTCRIK